jgi:hypothetical protein
VGFSLHQFPEALVNQLIDSLKTGESDPRQRILASLIAGAGVDEIGAAERLTRRRTESILCDKLRNRWVAPAGNSSACRSPGSSR